MTAVVITLALALAGAQSEAQEKPRVPKDSIELTVTGCLQGRVLSTTGRRTEIERGPYVGERSFRLQGKKDVMSEVKRRNHQLVEVVGLVKRSALDDSGVRIGGVSISGGAPVAGSGGIPHGADAMPVMDISSIRVRSTSCRPE